MFQSLPFASKPKQLAKKNPDTYMNRRRVKISEPGERKRNAILTHLATIGNVKKTKRVESGRHRQAERLKKREREKSEFSDVHKEVKRRKYAREGMEEAHREKRKG